MSSVLNPTVNIIQGDLDNPDRATYQTIVEMLRLTYGCLNHPRVRELAARCRRSCGVLDWYPTAERAFWETKHRIKFVHHQQLLRMWLNKADALQLLLDPAYVLSMKVPVGDCAIYVMVLAAILSLNGMDFEIDTVKADPRQPDLYTHVFLVGVSSDPYIRLPLDASHGPRPGWEVPSEHRFFTQRWSSTGVPLQDGQGLYGYRRPI